ncbi:MAG: RICIN domain-containing protein [Cyanobacteria bacterium J06560_5]
MPQTDVDIELPQLKQRWIPSKLPKIELDPKHSVAGVFVVKFAEGSQTRLTDVGFQIDTESLNAYPFETERLSRTGLTPQDAITEIRSVDTILAEAKHNFGFEVEHIFRPVGFRHVLGNPFSNAQFIEKIGLERRALEELADLDLYYVVYAENYQDLLSQQALMNRINQFRVVEQVYAAVPAEGAQASAPPTTNISSAQGYLDPAPTGVDGRFAWTKPGGKGTNVRIVDIEYDWVYDHEDFPNRANHFQGSRPPFYDRKSSEHGTAVMGVISSPHNGFGIDGFAPNASWGTESVLRLGPYAWALIRATWDAIFQGENWKGVAHNLAVSAAIESATSENLRAGDIVLIEQHAAGPSPGVGCTCNQSQCEYVAMEYFQDSFDVIRRATARGIIVVEAAGNGSQDLDDSAYRGRFDLRNRDSGALLVGASEPSNNYGVACFSNTSKRVDVHTWGGDVHTIGYGDSQPHPYNIPEVTRFYTKDFGGTSSASAIVTGAVASLQGTRRGAGRLPYTPVQLRDLLVNTGTPQQGVASVVAARHIGTQPDLKKAVQEAIKPVSAPSSSAVSRILEGDYVIQNQATGKVMDVDVSWFGGPDDGRKLIQWDFHGGWNQQFRVIYATDDSSGRPLYSLYPLHSAGIIEIGAASRTDGGLARQWRPTSRLHQFFRIERIGDSYRIIAAHSGKALEVPFGSFNHNGGQIAQRSWLNNDAQLWRLIEQ